VKRKENAEWSKHCTPTWWNDDIKE